jgi:hypothetical protein
MSDIWSYSERLAQNSSIDHGRVDTEFVETITNVSGFWPLGIAGRNYEN